MSELTSMRGASAEALAALTEELETAVSGGSDASGVGTDLFSVSSVLRSEPGLRRTLTDVSLDPAAKEGLVRDIFGDPLATASVDITAQAVSRRWTVPRDLADALEQLGVVAIVKSAEGDGQADRLADELFSFGEAVRENPALRDALSDPARTVEDKRGLVHGLLEGKALPSTITLAGQALAGTHRTVGVAIREYQQVAARVHGQSVATVQVARELSEADRQRLADALSRQYDRRVHLNVVLDPEVIGGIRVEIGDDVIDGTVSNRLDNARRQMAS